MWHAPMLSRNGSFGVEVYDAIFYPGIFSILGL
jgi:hypothetical protein